MEDAQGATPLDLQTFWSEPSCGRGAHRGCFPGARRLFTVPARSYCATVVTTERPSSKPARSRATTTTERRGSLTWIVVS